MENRLPHLRDRQPIDCAPEKKSGIENSVGAKPAQRRILQGKFAANTIDLAFQ
jgi:hypothetical protein